MSLNITTTITKKKNNSITECEGPVTVPQDMVGDMQGGTYPRSNPANLWGPTTTSVMVIAHADDLVVNHEPTNQKQQR